MQLANNVVAGLEWTGTMVTVHTQHHGSYNVASNEVVISDIGIIVSEHGKPRRYFPDGEVTLIVEYVEGDNTE